MEKKSLQTALTKLREHLPSFGGKPSASPPERFEVGGPLDAINDSFHEAYDESKHEARQEVPVFVVLGDELIVFSRGERSAYSFSPRSFHVIKSVTHAPLALYSALYRLAGEPIDATGQKHLATQRHRIGEALERLDEDAGELAERTRDDLRALLTASASFVDSIEESVPLSTLDSFARPLGAALLRLADDATELQLDALHEHVEHTVRLLDKKELTALQVVVAGDHQARARSLAMQYFQKRLAEPEDHERRVCYAEGVADEQAALALVGTRRLDHALGRAFFGNEARLQRDILGDAAKARLKEKDLELLVGRVVD